MYITYNKQYGIENMKIMYNCINLLEYFTKEYIHDTKINVFKINSTRSRSVVTRRE